MSRRRTGGGAAARDQDGAGPRASGPRGRARRCVVVGLAAAAGAACAAPGAHAAAGADVLGLPAGHAPIPTTLAGWQAVGPVGVGRISGYDALGSSSVLVGTSHDLTTGSDGPRPFLAITATGRRWGLIDRSLGGPARWDTPRRLVLGAGCAAGWASADLGATWRASGAGPCSDAELALGPGTAVRVRDVGTRTVDGAAVGGRTLERTEDGGATWTPVALPGGLPGGDGTDALPDLGGPWYDGGPAALVRRADGTILVGARGALLSSTDDGRSFTAIPLPVPDALAGFPTPRASRVVCDPAGTCVVELEVLVSSTFHTATVAFSGTSFGGVLAPLPRSAVIAPAPGVVAGLGGVTAGGAAVEGLLRSTDGGRTYAEVRSGAQLPRSVGDHHVLAVPLLGEIQLSGDRGATWTAVPGPGTRDEVRSVARAGGVVLATLDGGRLQRRAHGRWSTVAGATAIRPAAVAAAGEGFLVAGSRGLVRVARSGVATAVRSPALSGRRLHGVAASGRLAFAWGTGFVVRSADGGRHWTRVRGLGTIQDLQVVSERRVVAVGHPRVYRSTDGGRRFRGGARFTDLSWGGPNSGGTEDVPPRVEMTGPDTGAFVSPWGVFTTRDGGRTVEQRASPGGRVSPLAIPWGARGLLAQDRGTGTVLRSTGTAFRRPRVTLRAVGRAVPAYGHTRTVTVAGRLTGAAAGGRVFFAAERPGRAPRAVGWYVDVNVDGTFRTSLAAIPSWARRVRAVYEGRVTATRTDRSARSALVRLP